MAFKRRSYGRRKSFRRKRYGGRSFGTRVKRVVRAFAERKRALMEWSAQEFDWNGHRKYLDEIAQGTDEGQRVGRIVTPHSFVARLELRNTEGNSTPGTGNTSWTAMLVQDTQQVGDQHAAVSEIISGIGSTLAPMGLMSVANKGRFKIHRRWQGTLIASTAGDSAIRYLKLYHKFRKPRSIRYNGTAATDIEANGLMFILVSNADPTADSVYATGYGRLWYTDV